MSPPPAGDSVALARENRASAPIPALCDNFQVTSTPPLNPMAAFEALTVVAEVKVTLSNGYV